MTSEAQKKDGWLLPTPITGYDLICVRLKIPNNREYRTAFTGALHMLDSWYNWEKSYTPGDTRASQAAFYWRGLLDDNLIIEDCSSALIIDGFQTDTSVSPFKLLISYDGGQTYQDAPLELDPRHGNGFRLPLLNTADPRCDAAANMVYWIKKYIDASLSDIDAALAAAAALDVLIFFIPGVDVIFAFIMVVTEALLTIGATIINAAFTQEVYDGLKCIIYCNIGNDGSVSAAQLDNINAAINTQYPGTVEDVMYYVLYDIFGEVGLSNAGTQGDQTGDCSACDACNWCHKFDFAVDDGGFIAWVKGTYVPGFYWDGVTSLAGGSAYNCSVGIQIDFPSPTNVLSIAMTFTTNRGTASAGGASYIKDPTGSGTILVTSTDANHTDYSITWNGARNMDGVQFWCNGSRSGTQSVAATGTAHILSVEMTGTGDDPFPDVYRCP